MTPSEIPETSDATVAVEPASAAPAPHPGHARNRLVIGLALSVAALMLLGCVFCAGVFVGSHGPQRGGFRDGMRGRGGYGYQLPQQGGQGQGMMQGPGGMRGRPGFGGQGVPNGPQLQGAPDPTTDATTGI